MSMPKVPGTPMPPDLQMNFPSEFVNIGQNAKAYDHFIKGHGIRMVHRKPLPCPNQKTLHGGDHDPKCPMCQNGFIYYGDKPLIAAFMGNNNQRNFLMNGSLDIDQAQILLPSKYEDGTEIDVQFFDQFVVESFVVRYYQRVQANQAGIDKLHFPATSVDACISANGTEYAYGVDFELTSDGQIKWIGQNRPGYDMSIDMFAGGNGGEIYSVNYYTKPVFTVISLPHQLRVTQTVKDGVAVQERFPQSCVVRKEFIIYRASSDGEDSSPKDGQTGPG